MGHLGGTRWAVGLLASLLALASAGCMRANEVTNERSLAGMISREVSGVTGAEVRAEGDGFNHEYSISVRGRSDTGNIAEARMLARQVSKVVWHNAKGSARHISVDLELTSCVSETPCTGVSVDIPTDAARRLWGDAEHGDRTPGDSGETFVLTEADGLPAGWEPAYGITYSPDLTYDVTVPPGRTEQDIRAGADRIAAVLWREHPDRLRGISVHVISPSPESDEQLELTYSVDELRAKFGARAPDLDQ
jgi:hypothetical protein